MRRITDIFNVSFPPALAEQVRRTAKAENRSISELFRECYRAYRKKRTSELFDVSHQAFRNWAIEKNLSEEQMKQEVEAALTEVKNERRQSGEASRKRDRQKMRATKVKRYGTAVVERSFVKEPGCIPG